MVDVDAAPPQMRSEIDLMAAVDHSTVQLPGCADGESSIEATNTESEADTALLCVATKGRCGNPKKSIHNITPVL